MPDNRKNLHTEKLVDEALATDPGFLLPDNFADILAEKVSHKLAWMQYLKEFFVYLSVIIGIGIGIAGMSVFWFNANYKTWLDFVGSNVGMISGITIVLTFILFADRVLLRYFMFKSKLEVT